MSFMNSSAAIFLAELPILLAALIAMGVPVLIAVLLGNIIFALFTEQELGQNALLASVKYGFVIEAYVTVAAVTLVGAWDIYSTTRDILQKEAHALYMLALSVDTYLLAEQAELRDNMRTAIRAYAADIVSLDWPSLQAGVAVTGSDAAFHRLARVFLNADNPTTAQAALGQNIPVWVAQAAEARMSRFSVTSRAVSGLIWFLVMLVSVAVIVFQWFFSGPSRGLHYAMGLVTAMIVGSVLLVAVKLAHPLAGDTPLLSNRPFLELMQVQ